MSITISGELQSLVQQELAAGHYQTTDEVLLTAVRLLSKRNKKIAELRREILPALERLDRGEGGRSIWRRSRRRRGHVLTNAVCE